MPSPWLRHYAVEYFGNSFVAGDAAWNKLVQGAVDNELYLVSPRIENSFYNGQIFIDYCRDLDSLNVPVIMFILRRHLLVQMDKF